MISLVSVGCAALFHFVLRRGVSGWWPFRPAQAGNMLVMDQLSDWRRGVIESTIAGIYITFIMQLRNASRYGVKGPPPCNHSTSDGEVLERSAGLQIQRETPAISDLNDHMLFVVPLIHAAKAFY